MTDLYTVLDVGADGDITGQYVEVDTSLDDAKTRRDELQAMAVDDREAADFRVYQLVEPGHHLPLLPALEELPMPEQRVRLEAARLAVEHYRDADSTDGELVATAKALGDYIQDGTADPQVRIGIRRTDERIEVWINGELTASTDYDQAGHAGMDAVHKAACTVARALGVEPDHVVDEEPEA